MEKKILPYLVIVSAILVSVSAAFYSVTGIGKMFSGSATNVMIMMASLEISKLVLASLLYQYWSSLNTLLKTYYFIAIFVLMGITSAGIYGYLSAAYSETSNKVEAIDKQVSVLDIKRKMYQSQLDDIKTEKQRITDNITDLTKGLSNNANQVKGSVAINSQSKNRNAFEGQLKSVQKRRDDISIKETALSDSLSKIDLAKLNLETNTGIAQEIGPLKYIAKLTGKTTDVVVNWFIIALMLVFDPLAVSLVVGANMIFGKSKDEEEKKKLSEEIDSKIESFKKIESDFTSKKKEFDDELSLKRDEFNKQQSDFDEYKIERERLIGEKELELENEHNRIKYLEKELIKKIDDEQSKIDELQLKLDSDMSIHSDESSKLIELQKELLQEKEDLLQERKELEEDMSELQGMIDSLKDEKDDLSRREYALNEVRDDLYRLDREIKEWEGGHWKMRRNPPSSAIID